MKKPIEIIVSFLFFAFISSCQKPFLDPNAAPYDADAQKFIDSAAISDKTEQLALTDFVIALKDSSLWGKFKAVYPMLGGTANSTKWNLIDPRDLDISYRLTFNGAPVFSNDGVLFTTTSDYADTHLVDSELQFNNSAISYYSLTQNTINGYDIGCVDFAVPYNEFAIYNSIDASDWFGYYHFGASPVSTKGLFVLSFTLSDAKRYDNSVVTYSKGSSPTQAYTKYPILIGKVNGAASGGQRECAMATIGDGLQDADVLKFYNIVQKFETSIGR